MRRLRGMACPVALALVYSLPAASMAATYTFTVLSDSSGPYQSYNNYPAINDLGQVVFIGLRDGASGWDLVVDDGATSTVYGSTPFPAEFNDFFEQPSINNNGVVAVYASSTACGDGIHKTDGTTVTRIASHFCSGQFGVSDTYNAPSINDSGLVVFQGDADSSFNSGFKGVYAGDGVTSLDLTTLVYADQGDGYAVFFGKTHINSLGAAVFRATSSSNVGTLLVSDGTTLTTIADASGPFNGFSDASINDDGLVAFSANLDAGGSGVYTGDGSSLTTIVETPTSDYSTIGTAVAMNNNGDVAFVAGLDAGGAGVFTGPDAVADKVIQIGDALLGSTVSNLDLQVEAINDSGQITFWATLADGRFAVVRAEPVVESNNPPTADAGGPYTVDEGGSVLLTASGTDPDGDALDYAWDLDGDGTYETPGQSVSYSAAGLDGPSSDTVTVQVTDEGGLSATSDAVVNVENVAPVVGAITAPIDPVEVNTTISASADFTDAGVPDTHTAVWDWGDGATSAGTVTQAAGSGSVADTHTYTLPGVYTLILTVTDDDGDSGESFFQYIVVYDPEGGFVTGGGWIDSPAGAYAADPTLTGKANFGFNSKYKKGASIPTGQTQFQFKTAGLNFHSDTYEWLVVSGARAQFKGSGTINGTGDYGFLLTAIDGDINGGGGTDKFRIKIWEQTTGDIVYDNQMGADDGSDASTALGGGSIVIHNK